MDINFVTWAIENGCPKVTSYDMMMLDLMKKWNLVMLQSQLVEKKFWNSWRELHLHMVRETLKMFRLMKKMSNKYGKKEVYFLIYHIGSTTLFDTIWM